MEKYSEENFAKLIDDCEILILPDNSSIDDVLSHEDQSNYLSNLSVNHNSKSEDQQAAAVVIEARSEETDDDFEQLYQRSKLKRHNVIVSVFKVQIDGCLIIV